MSRSHEAFKHNKKFGRCVSEHDQRLLGIVGPLSRESFAGEREESEQAHAEQRETSWFGHAAIVQRERKCGRGAVPECRALGSDQIKYFGVDCGGRRKWLACGVVRGNGLAGWRASDVLPCATGRGLGDHPSKR